MSVTTTVQLPAQPATGVTEYVALGGDGKFAPMGCYFIRSEIEGDATAGSAAVNILMDRRYTNLCSVVNPTVEAGAAATEMSIQMSPDSASSSRPHWTVVTTAPFVVAATAFNGNSSFMWYPPPVYYSQGGFIGFVCPNVGILETYVLTVEIYVFDPEVVRLTPMPFLQWNVPGVSAPPAL